MQLEFAHPLLLWLAAPCFAHTLWMARRLQALSRVRRVVAVATRLLVLSTLIAAVAGARVSYRSNKLTVFFVVDDSDSVPEEQKEYAKLFVQRAHKEMGKDDAQWIVLFGSDASIEQTPVSSPAFEAPEAFVDGSRTHVAGAIQLALACASGASQKRIVLLSDGNQNAGGAEDAARAAAASGVSIDVVPLKYENRNDVIVEKAIVENRVSLDEPFDVRVIATTSRAVTGKLSIHQDGNLVFLDDVELTPGHKNSFVVPTEVRDAGYHRFEAQLYCDDDAIPENNRAFAFTYGEGEPRILLVDGDGQPSLTLPAALRAENIHVEVTDPGGLPHSLRALQTYDAVVFNNVPAGDITLEQMKLIEYAVHDLGVGFAMIGGENSFGAGGYNDSPIERVLPVEMELKNEKILPQGALVPIIHTVEIPQGQYWAEQIIHAALDVLSPRDLMGVLQYSWQSGESWLFPLQEVGPKTHLRAQLANAQWGDMPSFDTTLQMAYNALSACPASVKHIVVISDGDPQTPNWNLTRKIQADRITISTVCINPHSPRDAKVMQDLARLGGGNFYYPKNNNELPQIFIKEATTIRKSLIFEESFVPVVKQYSPVLVGLGDGYPTLLGYVGTCGKGLADVPLETPKGDPLFAHWRHGLGKTVAFTSDAKERWGKQWIDWNQYSKFWAQTTRWVLRQPFNRNFQVQMEVDGANGKIIVDAVDDNGDFRNFLNVAGRIITPSLEATAVTFRQTAPGRYETTFEVNEAGSYMLGAQAADSDAGDDASGELLTGGVSLSYSPEFRNSRSNEALLYRLADLTGGRVLDETSRVFRHDRPSRSLPTPAWPWLLTALLFVFLFDVFVRRVIIGWSDVAAALGFVWDKTASGIVRRRGAQAEGVSQQLFQAKKQALAKKPAPREGDREEFLASLRDVKVDRRTMGAGESRRPIVLSTATDAGAKGEAEGEATFTGQLLKARARAQKQMGAPRSPKTPPQGGDRS